MMLRVNEIFYSIQGESLDAGLPCVFVRLTGCNLRCRYCDTRYAHGEGEPMSIETIMDRVAAYPCRRVEITGGEPLLQPAAPRLITTLLDTGRRVLLETNGTFDIRAVDPRCVRIMDVKCPGSGAADKNRLSNLHYLTPNDQVKFVITDKTDYDFAKTILQTAMPAAKSVPVLFSPVPGRLAPDELAAWILADGLDARLQLQLHKILWPHEPKGR